MKEAEKQKIRGRFDEVLRKHISRLMDTMPEAASLPFDLTTITSLILFIERESEIEAFPDAPPDRYTEATLIEDLTDTGLEIDENAKGAIKKLSQMGFATLENNGQFVPRQSTPELVGVLDNMFPGMPGLNFVAYIIQTIDEALSGRKDIDHAISQFDQTLQAKGVALSAQNQASPATPQTASDKKSTDKKGKDRKQAYLKKLSKMRSKSARDTGQTAGTKSLSQAGAAEQPKVVSLFPKAPPTGEPKPADEYIDEDSVTREETADTAPSNTDESASQGLSTPETLQDDAEKALDSPEHDQPVSINEEADHEAESSADETADSDTEPVDDYLEQKDTEPDAQPDIQPDLEPEREPEPGTALQEEIESRVESGAPAMEEAPSFETHVPESEEQPVPETLNAEETSYEETDIKPEESLSNESFQDDPDTALPDEDLEEVIDEKVKEFQESLAMSCPVCKEGRISESTTGKGKRYYVCQNEDCGLISWGKPYHFACPLCQNPFLIEFSSPQDTAGLKCPKATCNYRQDNLDSPLNQSGSPPPPPEVNEPEPVAAAEPKTAAPPQKKRKRVVRKRLVRKKR